MELLDLDDDVLKVNFKSCPVQASLGILGHKWALLIIRNIGLYHKHRFNEMLKITPGLTKRILSIRLKELESENFIEVIEKGRNYTKWELTEKGRDSLVILMVMAQFGSKYYADKVFKDSKPRNLDEIFDESYIQKIFSNLLPENTMFDTRTISNSSMNSSIKISQESNIH